MKRTAFAALLFGLVDTAPAGVRADEPKPAAPAAQKREAASAPQKKEAAPATAAKAAPPPDAAIDADQQLDAALEHYYAGRHAQAAASLHALYRALPENDLKRDTAAFFLAESLGQLGLSEGAVEHHVDIVAGRRTPDLVVRSLGALDRLVRAGLYDDNRLIDEVLFGSQFGDLPDEVHDFVEYYQGLGELRRGFGVLGVRRLEALAAEPKGHGKAGYYRWRSRYALAVDALARRSDEDADDRLRTLVESEAAPRAVRNEARTSLARRLYEQRRFPEAFDLYSKNDAPLTEQDVILLEKAWTKVGARDEQRALGMVVGLGAPVYKLAFSPERWLIRASSLDRLCQFRAAHVAVRDFRRTFDRALRHIHDRAPLDEEPVLRGAALARADLVPAARWRARLAAEKATAEGIADEPLREHLATLYTARGAQADAAVRRSLPRALDVVADELLGVDEQMTILDYEIGVGLFKGVTGGDRDRSAATLEPIPLGGDRVYHRFDGEYWSDEIQDYQVRAEDRCLR